MVTILGSVEDTSQGSLWDSTTPNATIRHRLKELLEHQLGEAAQFDILSVTRHMACPIADSHEAFEPGDLGISRYRDDEFDWPDLQLYQGYRHCTCPCQPESRPSRHWVIEELIVRRRDATRRHDYLASALFGLQRAVDAAAEKRPRSDIRENLLLTLLALNDGILPKSVAEFVAERTA